MAAITKKALLKLTRSASNSMGKLRRIALGIFGSVLALAALLVTFNAEARGGVLLLVAPGYFRDVQFLRFADSQGHEVYLLGTIHTDHLTTPSYSLLHLQTVLEHLKPDLLLVESRPEELVKDNWGDGPIEMPFVSLKARTADIETQGMDWWVKESVTSISSNSDEREDRMFQNILTALPNHQTVLILTGWSHVEGFQRRLLESGYNDSPFPAAEKKELFSIAGMNLIFPKGMTHYIQHRIEIDRLSLQSETDSFWRDRIEKGIAVRQELLKKIAEVGERQP